MFLISGSRLGRGEEIARAGSGLRSSSEGVESLRTSGQRFWRRLGQPPSLSGELVPGGQPEGVSPSFHDFLAKPMVRPGIGRDP